MYSPSSKRETSERLGIGLIGLGRHGMRYAKHLAEDFPRARLAGFTRKDTEQAARDAKALGVPAYPDYRALIAAPDVDAVAVVVPPVFHPDIVAEAAERGKAVLLEKPAAINLEDGLRLRRSVSTGKIPVMVAQTMRYNETVTLLMSERHRIGRLHSVRISQRFEPSPTSWIYDPIAGGGTTLQTGVHGFDLMRFLTGLEALHVSAEIGNVQEGAYEDHFSAVVKLTEGAIATVSGSRATSGRTGSIELVGDAGQLVADHVLRTAVFISGNTTTPLPIPPPVSTIALTLADFLSALDTGGPMPISLDDGLRAVALAEAAVAAARTGRATPVPSPESLA